MGGGEGNRRAYRCHNLVVLAWAYPARHTAAPGSNNDNGGGASHAREGTNEQPRTGIMLFKIWKPTLISSALLHLSA